MHHEALPVPFQLVTIDGAKSVAFHERGSTLAYILLPFALELRIERRARQDLSQTRNHALSVAMDRQRVHHRWLEDEDASPCDMHSLETIDVGPQNLHGIEELAMRHCSWDRTVSA